MSTFNKTYIEPYIEQSLEADVKLSFTVEGEDISGYTFTASLQTLDGTEEVGNANITIIQAYTDPDSSLTINIDKAQLSSLTLNTVYKLVLKDTTNDEVPVIAKISFV